MTPLEHYYDFEEHALRSCCTTCENSDIQVASACSTSVHYDCEDQIVYIIRVGDCSIRVSRFLLQSRKSKGGWNSSHMILGCLVEILCLSDLQSGSSSLFYPFVFFHQHFICPPYSINSLLLLRVCSRQSMHYGHYQPKSYEGNSPVWEKLVRFVYHMLHICQIVVDGCHLFC